MEILICVKQVPDDEVEIHLDPETMTPDLSRANPQISAFEAYGMEMAVRYTEEHGGSVTVVAVGPEDQVATIRNCLAVGATRGYLISNEGLEDADAFMVAQAISVALPKMEEDMGTSFDLILAGRESTDYIDGEVGGILAELLGLPHISNVVGLEEDQGALVATKELDEGYQKIEASLPAVITASKPDYDPRYPTIKSKLAAKKMEVPLWTAGDIGLEKSEGRVSYLRYIDPPRKEPGEKLVDMEPEAAASAIMERLASNKIL